MSEIIDFTRRNASKVTPDVLKRIHKKLPLLKMEFSQLNAPNYPHLVDQLEFLANVVEDFAEGAAEDLPYVAVAWATYALIYAHRQIDLIPDSIPDIGHADDSAVVRATLIEHENVWSRFADSRNWDWDKITSKA
jgi:uncharacterized membrane protein YkvA (DUF1232 family)